MKKLLLMLILISNLFANQITIKGKLLNKHQNGKDGFVYKFQSEDKKIYLALFSIPNLGFEESKKLDFVKEGALLELQGENFKLLNKERLTVRKIKVLKK